MRSSFAYTLLLLGGLAASAAGQEPLTTPADPNGIVRVVAVGDVRVRANSSNEVRVIDLDDRNERGLRLRRDGAQVEVDIYDDRDVEILVPADSRLDIRNSGGDIDIAGVRGSVAIETANGDMVVRDSPSSVTMESISGDARVTGPVQTVRINSVSGDIELPDAAGTLDVTSTSGDIDVGGSGIRSGDFTSTSGTIRFSADIRPDAVLEFTSASGTIELHVPADVAADFDIENITGRVRNDIGPDPRRNRYTGGESLRFTNGGGGARVVVRNVSGGVYLLVR